MRIVHINTHDVEGGAARMALRLAQRQRAAGHEATLLVGRRSLTGDLSQRFDPAPEESLRPFCEAARLPYLHFQGSHRLPQHPLAAAADVLHVHNLHFDYCNPFSLSFCSHAKPTIWTLHDLFPVTGLCMHPGACATWALGKLQCAPCHRQRLNAPHTTPEPDAEPRPGPDLGLQWKRLLYEHCHLTFVCPSHWMREQVRGSIIEGMPVEVVHNGVDTEIFRPLDKIQARQALGLEPGAPVLGAVAVQGAFDNPLKGGAHLRRLLEILHTRHPEAVLLNIGSDAPDTHPGVRNIPYVEDRHELARIYAALDLLVHAAAGESFCLVAVEAMACGLPVAAFDVGPLPEVVAHGETGLLCPLHDVEALAGDVLRLIEDPGLRQRMGQAGRRRSLERFDFSATQAGYQRLYEAELERRAGGVPVLAFDIPRLPALLRTPEFMAAEGRKTGRNLSDQALSEGHVQAFLDQLPKETRRQLEPLHRKAEDTRRVFALRNAGELQASLALLERLTAEWPEDATLQRTRGVTLGLLGRDEEAIDALQQCLQAAPPLTDVWLNMADIHLRAGRLTAARQALETFRAIDPNLRGCNHRLGLLHAAEGDQRSAVRFFCTELRLHGSPESVAPLREAWQRRHRAGAS